MSEIHKIEKNGVTIYPATTTDAVVDKASNNSLASLILTSGVFSISNKYISSTSGLEANGSKVKCTPFIKIRDNKIFFRGGMLDERVATIAYYDKDFNFISCISNNSEYVDVIVEVTDIPLEAVYYRLSTVANESSLYYALVSLGDIILQTEEIRNELLDKIKSIYVDVPASFYPYLNKENKSDFDKALIDLNIIGANDNDNFGLFTLTKLEDNNVYIRICYLNDLGEIDTNRGDGGIAVIFVSDTAPSGIVTLKSTAVYEEILEANCIVNTDLLTTNIRLPEKKRVINPRCYVEIKKVVSKSEVYTLQPVSNEVVWSNKTYFPTLDWMRNFIVSLDLYSETFDPTIPICIGLISVNEGGRTFITIHRVTDESGQAPADGASQICLYDTNPWNAPSENNGHRYQTLSLKSKNSSGVEGTITVDWSALPNINSYIYRYFKVYDSLLSAKVFKGTRKIEGANLLEFNINGVPAKVQTSNLYNSKGNPDWLMIICHGNGQGNSLPLPTESKQWFLDHGISIATIRTQDQTGLEEYTTNATGWGNFICINRIVQLYNYLQENYNFKKTVILAGASMGGCTLGALLYKKPFPIAFGLGVGAVPGVKIMFENSSESYKKSIRAAYDMNKDGSDDVNIANFINGYDWYNMGSVGEQKIGFPNLYMYYGNDSTWRNNFQGETTYPEIVGKLISGGSYSFMKQAGTTDIDAHATDKIYTLAINDKIFEKELGII